MKNRKWTAGGGLAVVVAALAAGYGAIGAAGSHDDSQQNALAATATVSQNAPLVTLYKNPTCACCGEWADHMRASGFRVDVREDVDFGALKKELGVPFSVASCHTAEVDGYALEGHVPADVVKRLLSERPDIAGLAVPGMPAGVPGMPGEGFGSYDVLTFHADGATQVYASK